MKRMEKNQRHCQNGSARTAIVATLSIIAIIISVFSLIRYQQGKVHPRDLVQEFFKCEECGNVFGMTIAELHEKLASDSDEISVNGNDVAVSCPQCDEMAKLAVECPHCHEYFVLPKSGPYICPHCGTDIENWQSKE